MRKSKGYTGELEKITRQGSGITLKIAFKAFTTKKNLRLKVWGYSQGKYLNLRRLQGLKMTYKTYKNAKENDIAS